MFVVDSQTVDLFKHIRTDLDNVEARLRNEIKSDNRLIQEVINHVINAGGKRIRPAIAILVSKALNSDVGIMQYQIAEIAEMIHTATLMHDDVIDSSMTRRGVSTINAAWSNKVAVITGDYLLSLASIRLAHLGNLEIVEIFANVLKEICIGEIQQDLDKFNVQLKWKDYINKSTRKTATLFAATAKSAAIISNASRDVVEKFEMYGEKLGLAFQIADDLLNVIGDPLKVGKSSFDDLENGIITAPTLFTLESPYGEELSKIISSRFAEEFTMNRVLELIDRSGAIQKTKDLAENYIQEACDSIKVIEDSVYKEVLLQVAQYAGNRKL